MNAIIKVPNPFVKNFTQGEVIKFRFDWYNSQLIHPLENDSIMFPPPREKEYVNKFADSLIRRKSDIFRLHNKILSAIFLKYSKIDKFPIFEIDVYQLPSKDDILETTLN